MKPKRIILRQQEHYEIYNLFIEFWNNVIVPEIVNYSYNKLTPIDEITKIVESITPVKLNQGKTPPQWGFYSKSTRKTKNKKTKKPKSVKRTKTVKRTKNSQRH